MAEVRPIRFEAHPTRMFGAYQVVAILSDGKTRVVEHGDPHHCLRRAQALTAALPAAG